MNTEALIATRKGLFKLDKHSKLELIAFEGVPVSMILASRHYDTWYAALDHGHFGVKLHRSDDAGESWKEVSAPAYPKAEEGASLELIWSLQYASDGNPLSLWAGTIPGGLFYSADGGENWSLNESLWSLKREQKWFGGGYDNPGIHSICVDPDNNNYLTLGISVAGVYVSTDGGDNWQNKSSGMRAEYMPPDKQFDSVGQDPHKLMVAPSDGNRLWAQHHNGIFISSDGSGSWSEVKDVKPSVFGFALAVHPHNADTAWFVPAVKDECRVPVDGKMVVTRTRDGGLTFETLDSGLPQNSYDLVYRHGLDIDHSGEKLIMGSTTGNAWLSRDQGDNWLLLSNYLPPVYAVKFL